MARSKFEDSSSAPKIRKYLMEKVDRYTEISNAAMLIWFWNNEAGQRVMIELNRYECARLSVNDQIRITSFQIENILTYLLKLDKWNRLQQDQDYIGS
jgi:hypothetical protein